MRSNLTSTFNSSLKNCILLLTQAVNKVSSFTVNLNSAPKHHIMFVPKLTETPLHDVNKVSNFSIAFDSSLEHHIMLLTHVFNKVSNFTVTLNSSLKHHIVMLTKVSNFTVIFNSSLKHHMPSTSVELQHHFNSSAVITCFAQSVEVFFNHI